MISLNKVHSWVSETQQSLERVRINLADKINTLSRGFFSLEPKFTGKNEEELDTLKTQFTNIRQKGYSHDKKAFDDLDLDIRRLKIDYLGLTVKKSPRLELCWSRIENELKKMNIEPPKPPPPPKTETPPPPIPQPTLNELGCIMLEDPERAAQILQEKAKEALDQATTEVTNLFNNATQGFDNLFTGLKKTNGGNFNLFDW